MNFKNISLIAFLFSFTGHTIAQNNDSTRNADKLYAPGYWQTTLTQPLSSRKVFADHKGRLLYEYPANDPHFINGEGYGCIIGFQSQSDESVYSQELANAQTPVVITHKKSKDLQIQEELFTVAPSLFGNYDSGVQDYLGTALNKKIFGQPGNDILLITLENPTNETLVIHPSLILNSAYPFNIDTCKGKIQVADFLRIQIPYRIDQVVYEKNKTRNVAILSLKEIRIAGGEKIRMAIGVAQGYRAIDCPNNVDQAIALKNQSSSYWARQELPYDLIQISNAKIQNLFQASVRNLYQNMDQDGDLLLANTGSASGRKVYPSDAAFIIEALTMLNRCSDAQKAINQLLKLQNQDGSFQMNDKDWKATGYALWAISDYARLSGDKTWLETKWNYLEKGFNYLMEVRKKTLKDAKSSFTGLMPPGAGSEGQQIDYIQNYWTLAGLNSAITAARWTGRNGQAIKWQSDYDDFYNVFQASLPKNLKKDSHGTAYLPARFSADKKNALPQKGQWAFMNAVYPGKIFDKADPVVLGNLKMLEEFLKEGIPFGTGWQPESMVLTTASDYAHCLQWTGNAQGAAVVFQALANHAAPNFSWPEMQMEQGTKDTITLGDFPNSRVSAEYIRMLRHLLVMERGYELHLFEGVPAAWLKPGMEIKLNNLLTDFGTLYFKLKVSEDGTKAYLEMNLDTTNRRAPQKILFHLDGLAGNPASMELELKPNLKKVLTLN